MTLPFLCSHAQTACINGAGDRSRTRDLLITNQLLYQLSYASIWTLNQRFILIKHPSCCNSLAGGVPRLDAWILTPDRFQRAAFIIPLIKIQPVGGLCCIAGIHNGFKPVLVKHLQAYIHL
jgi:hypothetical protein